MRITVLSIQSISLQFWSRIQCNFETATESGTIIWLFASEDNRHCSLARDAIGYEPYWTFVEFYCEKSSTSFQLVGMLCLFCPTCVCMIIKLENMPFFHFVYCQHIVHCVVKMQYYVMLSIFKPNMNLVLLTLGWSVYILDK